jgi:peptidoglycan/LPS O-acetylase OafA/YrhL
MYGMHYTEAARFIVMNFQSIALGVVCAIYEPTVKAWAHRIPGWMVVFAALIMIFDYDLPASRLATMASLLLAPAIAVIILRSLDRSFWLRDLLLSPPIQFVGKISYALYLWQQIATGPYPNVGAGFYLVAVPAAFGIASLSWFLLEQPGIGLGTRLSRGIRDRHIARWGGEPDATQNTPSAN